MCNIESSTIKNLRIILYMVGIGNGNNGKW